jgi:cholesterol transport system auxiliary component
MKTTFRAQRLAAIAVALFALGGCALMGGGGKPPVLYTFGQSEAQTPAQSVVSTPVTVFYVGSRFVSQSSGNQILTETGNQVAYIAESRWVSPASELFDSAAMNKLQSISPSMRVVRVARPHADYVLGIEVQRFSAVYTRGQGAPPEVFFAGRAKLIRASDRVIIGDWQIDERVPATENRVSAIVAAFDQSTNAAVSQIADLTRMATATNGARS